ncbi:MAG: type II secretion system protein [Verrucomicrobiota bacterium]
MDKSSWSFLACGTLLTTSRMKSTRQNPQMQQRGFTLVELLVVIAIVVALMAIVVPITGGAMQRATKMRAKNACTELVNAVTGYYNAYNVLPANSPSPPSEDTEVESTEAIMSVLAGFNIDNMNRKETVFFNGEEAKGGSRNSAYAGLWRDSNSAELYDVWRKPAGKQRGYSIYIDYGYDNKLDDYFNPGGRVIARQVVTWSAGKDGEWNRGRSKQGANKDNVYSWF